MFISGNILKILEPFHFSIRRNKRLLDLDLSENSLTFPVYRLIEKLLKQNDSLKTLLLDENPLESRGIAVILTGLEVNAELT